MAHTLNLSVIEALGAHTELNSIIKKCRNIVTHFKHSVLAFDKLKAIQEQMGFPLLKVKQDVATRWNSCLLMIERLLQLKDALSIAVTSIPNLSLFLDAQEWNILNDCVPVLKPIEFLTTVLSGEKYITMSSIIPLIRALQFSLRNMTPSTIIGEALKCDLIEIINRRLGILEKNRIVACATFLDPRFKKIGFGVEENANNAQKWVSDEVIKLINAKRAVIASEAVPEEGTNKEKDDCIL